MFLSRLLLFCLAVSVQAGHLAFRATPRVAVESYHNSIKLDCRLPSTGQDVDIFILLLIQHTDVNGTETELAKLDPQDGLQDLSSNRTSVEGKSEPGSYYLTVTIEDPIEEDSGEYECRMIYVDSDYNAFTLLATENVTVSVSTTVYAPPPMACECDRIWEEIDNIKATLASKPRSVGTGGVVAADECQVSFSAYLEALTNVPISHEQTIVFDATRTNKGGAYDTATGEFTAPCDGQYYFSVALRSFTDLDAGYVDGVLMADEVNIARTNVFVDSPVSHVEMASTGTIVALTQGQKVKVVAKTSSTGSFRGQDYSIFSGFFVSA